MIKWLEKHFGEIGVVIFVILVVGISSVFIISGISILTMNNGLCTYTQKDYDIISFSFVIACIGLVLMAVFYGIYRVSHCIDHLKYDMKYYKKDLGIANKKLKDICQSKHKMQEDMQKEICDLNVKLKDLRQLNKDSFNHNQNLRERCRSVVDILQEEKLNPCFPPTKMTPKE